MAFEFNHLFLLLYFAVGEDKGGRYLDWLLLERVRMTRVKVWTGNGF